MATQIGTAPTSLQDLQSVQKVMSLPTVEAAVMQVGALYSKVKDSHSLLDWALSIAEVGVQSAAGAAAPIVTATPLSGAIGRGDARLAAAITELEKRAPIMKQPPAVIVDTTKKTVMAKIAPHVEKVCAVKTNTEQKVKSLKELSWAKANALLSTAYGQKAVHGLDTGVAYAVQLIDHYLPPTGPQDEFNIDEVKAASTEPAQRAAHTVGRVGSATAHRVWARLAMRLHELNKAGIKLEVRKYVAALLAALHLARATNAPALEPATPDRPAAPLAQSTPEKTPDQPDAEPAKVSPSPNTSGDQKPVEVAPSSVTKEKQVAPPIAPKHKLNNKKS